MITALRDQLQQEELRLPADSRMTDFNGKSLRLVAATFDTIGQEIAATRKGEQLDPSAIETNLTQPLADFGIKLERNPARAL